MTADAFADLVQAQRTGAGRWKARCPAHADRSPSLSIRAGDDGRVLVLCRAGCSLDSILAGLKLAKRDLFAGPPPSLEQTAAIQAARETLVCVFPVCQARISRHGGVVALWRRTHRADAAGCSRLSGVRPPGSVQAAQRLRFAPGVLQG
jgi:hypothetical protein